MRSIARRAPRSGRPPRRAARPTSSSSSWLEVVDLGGLALGVVRGGARADLVLDQRLALRRELVVGLVDLARREVRAQRRHEAERGVERRRRRPRARIGRLRSSRSRAYAVHERAAARPAPAAAPAARSISRLPHFDRLRAEVQRLGRARSASTPNDLEPDQHQRASSGQPGLERRDRAATAPRSGGRARVSCSRSGAAARPRRVGAEAEHDARRRTAPSTSAPGARAG